MRSNPSRRKAGRLTAGLAVFALLAAACGGDDDAADEPADQPAATDAPGDEPADEPAAAEEPGDEPAAADEPADEPAGEASGTLRVGTRAAFVTWDPQASRKEADLAYYAPVYEGLFELTSEGELQPLLVDTYEVTPEAIELTLLDGVTFHDGTPLDAEAVIYNLERIRDTPGFSQGTLSTVTEFEAVDPLTVRMSLSSPSPQILFGLARLAGQIVSPATLEDGSVTEHPVGTGPWMFNPDESSNTEFVFDVNPDYRDPSVPKVAQIRLYPEVDGPNPLAAGDLDIASFNTEDRDQMEQVGGEIAEGANIGRSFVFFDRGPGGVFEDPRVRQAVAHAIDREAFRDVAMSGTGNPQAVPATGSDFAAADDLTGLEYDPERAQELLAEAGVENLTFSIPVYGPFIAQGEALQAILAQSGITVELAQIDAASGVVATCASGDYEACIIPDDSVHPAQIYQRYLAADSNLNPAGVSSEAVDAAAEAAFNAEDLEAGEELWTDFFEIVFEEEVPVTYIIRELNMTAYNPDVVEDGVEMMYRVQAGVDYRTVRMK